MTTLENREAQILAVTAHDRDEVNEENPIIYAEGGVNRFATMTLFFPEEDGVRVQEDLDLNEVTVYYFNDEQETELTSGTMYDWAINHYRENY